MQQSGADWEREKRKKGKRGEKEQSGEERREERKGKEIDYVACSARRVADSASLACVLTDGGTVRGRQRLDDGAPNERKRTSEHFGGFMFPLLRIM